MAGLEILLMHSDLLESDDPTSLSVGTILNNKRRGECFTSVQPLPPAEFAAGAAPTVLNGSTSSSTPPPPDATGAVLTRLNPASQHLEVSFGYFEPTSTWLPYRRDELTESSILTRGQKMFA